ncbi:MAG TPA: cytochrome c [Ideonella sp.]|uniref:c-type cytochrome n=1 Tax=Ideonella sp. TaxID=1929293 RepID=UPI002BC83141|nr:cytochrome c [Ideonella sp.]HSI51030.1 cytochrome c [Ideonella sp.]
MSPGSSDWLPAWLALLEQAQQALLAALHALGLATELNGQPAWPFAQRLALEVLAIDRGLARSLLLAVLVLALALLPALAGLLWRRTRRPLWAGALLGLGAGLALWPWGQASLLWAPAVPSSFQHSPSGFSAAAIVQGAQRYQQLCVACHGASGSGDGPLAAQQPLWPPNLNRGLLARRREGELWWQLQHGAQDAQGRPTMPSFASSLSSSDAWQLLAYLQAQAAGQSLREEGRWLQPVALPELAVRCEGGPTRPLRSWTGQRLRLVAVAGGALLREDPRFITIAVSAPGQPASAAQCQAQGPEAWAALARIAGVAPTELAGTQFIADRQGWLRARNPPGTAGWRAEDLVCRAEANGAPSGGRTPADALDQLIARMDAEPVRAVVPGTPHLP